MNSLTRRTVGFFSGLCVGALLPFAPLKPANAAERVTLTFGFAEISTSVESLRAYGERGEVSEELAPYLKLLSDEQRSQFRQALQARQDVGPAQISQFLYSSIGDNILRYLGGIVQTAGRRDGAKGLRGALVLAAAEPEGLSVVGVLENFPTSSVRIDSLRGFQSFGAFAELIEDTDRAIAVIAEQSGNTQAPTSIELSTLTQPGPYRVSVQTIEVVDSERDRTLPTDLYLPEAVANAPLIVMSHGLAGDRDGFDDLGNHLASHGFAVAALDHPGSNRRQLEDLLQGAAQEIAQPTEFSARPRDITYLIDELARLNMASGPFANRIDTRRVGIIGHSFGGYTALATAGAQLDFDTLQANCLSDEFLFNAANPSMVLQCTALEAPAQFSLDLQDDRIQAVMAFNPVTSSLFGPTGFAQLSVPSLLVAGSNDPVAPALLEQIRPFTWLNRAETETALPHYLALIEGGSHLYDPPDLDGADVPLANSLVSADVPLAESYLRALSLGFMQAQIAQDDRYRGVVASPAGLSQQPLPLSVVSALSEEMLSAITEAPATEAPAELPAETPTEAVPLEENSPQGSAL
ncbi:MAG: alpha/beta fold hydrolase [Phormidesmis sp.]